MSDKKLSLNPKAVATIQVQDIGDSLALHIEGNRMQIYQMLAFLITKIDEHFPLTAEETGAAKH